MANNSNFFTKNSHTVLCTNKNVLKDYLIKEGNSYSNFILERVDRKLETSSHLPIHVHHIIPRHWGGTNNAWNLIKLSIEEHADAHQLLYENYGNFYDFGASNMLRGQISQGFAFVRKANLLKQKEKKLGFYNSTLQKELGARPKKQRQPYARNPFIKIALEKGLLVEWVETQEKVIIESLECSSLVDVINKLMTYPQMKEKKKPGKRPKEKKRLIVLQL